MLTDVEGPILSSKSMVIKRSDIKQKQRNCVFLYFFNKLAEWKISYRMIVNYRLTSYQHK